MDGQVQNVTLNLIQGLHDGGDLFDIGDGASSRRENKQISDTGCVSSQAKAVYDAGLELWKYYHSQPRANPDASFYDIRKFFQGETKGRMNSGSDDVCYTELIAALREKMKALAAKIAPKVYEFGFLK